MQPAKNIAGPICTNAAMRRAMRQLGQLYDHTLAPSGLKATQLGVLTQIKLLDGPRVSVLAQDLVMDISALGHTLKPMLRDGLIKLVPDVDDKRARRVVLTSAGKETLAQGEILWRQAHGRLEAMMGPDKAEQLRQTLNWIASPDFAESFSLGMVEKTIRNP